MNLIGNKISETRKTMGLTQEELAEQSHISLRTIQRIENNENEPRGKTLDLICDILQINKEELIHSKTVKEKNNIGTYITNGIFLLALNLLLVTLIGYTTSYIDANFNSRTGGFLLSFFIPIFIVQMTSKMNGFERMMKFGIGYITYLIMILVVEVTRGLDTFAIPCLVLALATLFFGDKLFTSNRK